MKSKSRIKFSVQNYISVSTSRQFAQLKVVLTFVILSTLFIACENDESVSKEDLVSQEVKMKSVQYQNLNAQMPEDYPDELINYTYSDLEHISLTGNFEPKTNLRTHSGNSFDEIIEIVRRKYPDFENADTEAYRRFFPDLSDRELIEKREVMFQYIEKLMGYEVAIGMAALRTKNVRTGSAMRILYTTTSCEQWYYASHLRLDMDGIKKARELALAKLGQIWKTEMMQIVTRPGMSISENMQHTAMGLLMRQWESSSV
jgi:hypothetical protein